MGYLDERFTIPPEQPEQRDGNVANTETQAADAGAQQTQATETQITTATETQAAAAQSETKPDEFFENFNKRFGTQFKDENELKPIFDLPKRVTEYEVKLKDAEERAKKADEYQKQIEEIRNAGNAEFLSKPLVRQAYVAQQLLEKYPDKDPDVLRQVVMADVSKMSDLDVLVKNQKIDLPNLSESDIKAVLLDKYGIDPETKPEEWSSISKAKIAIDAQGARANIKALTTGIELPKAVTKEERDAQAAQLLQQKIQATEPLKAEFTQFDKFKSEDFEFDVPSDYKSKLGDMFQAMFIDAGMEATKENLDTAKEMRDALFVLNNFGKIKEVIAKQAQVDLQKKLDETLNNTKLPNTATATDENTQRDKLPGKSLSAAFADNSI
jgi:hypothetical protein